MKISNVAVSRNSEYSDYCLGWESGGFRYHVWLNAEFGVQGGVGIGHKGPIMFKNPPLPLKRGDEGYFQTRYLKLDIAKNKAMLDDATAEAVAGHLFEKANEELAAKEKERLAQNAADYKIKLAQEAGPKMLAVLKAIDTFWRENDQKPPLAEAVRDAIAEAEGLPRA